MDALITAAAHALAAGDPLGRWVYQVGYGRWNGTVHADPVLTARRERGQ